MNDVLNVLIDTSPLRNANAVRGVGMYTKLLIEELQKAEHIHLLSEKEAVNERIDIVHYPFFDLFFPTLPLRKKAKTIITIHDVIPLIFPHFYKPGVKGTLNFFRQQFVAQQADAIITDSLASQKDIVRFLHIREEKVFVVPLAGNPSIHQAAEKEVVAARRKYHVPEKYILYVGDINYNKNIPQLIKACKFLPTDIHLVCVGKNFTAQKIPEWKAIDTQIALSNVADQLHFITDIGADGNETLSALYSGALAYVQPSLYEGFGLPVLEALQCGTPVVCSQNSSLIEVGDKYVQFVEPTAESLAEGIKNILALPQTERKKIADSGKKWAETFSWQKTAQKTTDVYQSVAKSL